MKMANCTRKASVIGKTLRARTYRKAMTVTHLRQYHDGNRYTLCPRCDSVIEREYVNFCNSCGQRLGWDARVMVVVRPKKGSLSSFRKNL